jgi:hypothetical protein
MQTTIAELCDCVWTASPAGARRRRLLHKKNSVLNLIKQQPYSYRNSLSHETGELQVCRHYGWHNSQRYVEE